jgi:hypothetical protein
MIFQFVYERRAEVLVLLDYRKQEIAPVMFRFDMYPFAQEM